MYYNKEEISEKVNFFYVICAIIIFLNIIGFIYEKYQDNQYDKAKESIQTLKEEQETGNVLEDTANACEYGAKQLLIAIRVFIVKILFGVIISALLIIPNMFYQYAEKEVLTCMIPDNKTECIVLAIVFVMTLYNMISPFGEIAECTSLLNETTNALDGLKIDNLINSISTFNY